MQRMIPALATVAAILMQGEPAPRRLGNPTGRFDGDLAAMSGARELPDGRVLLSDFRDPALYVVDLGKGTASRLGTIGSGPNEVRRPGGIYAGRGDTSLVLDRGQPRVLVVSPEGRIVGMRSIELRGSSSSSDNDVDLQRVDVDAYAYFSTRSGMRQGGGADSAPLLRLDAGRQRLDTVARLRAMEYRVDRAEGNMVFGRNVLFSPADGWGIASDGRVAVVRATPYRLDWIARDGRVTSGPAVAFDAVPVTAADLAPFTKQASSVSMGRVSGSGERSGGTSGSGREPLHASTKPPFAPEGIIVAPDGRVFVSRHLPAGATRTVYDLFDGRGVRVDRIELPAKSRIIGFGRSAIYVVERDGDDLPHLRKYPI